MCLKAGIGMTSKEDERKIFEYAHESSLHVLFELSKSMEPDD